LLGTSINGITGTWNPAVIGTATVGSAIYTFTPTAGLCANTTTMTIVVNPPVLTWTFTQDIGTTLFATWPPTPGASSYVIQWRPSTGGAWISQIAYNNYSKVVNLLANTFYDFRVVSYFPAQPGTFGTIVQHQTEVFPYVKTKDIGTTAQIGWDNCAPWASVYMLYYRLQGETAWAYKTSYTNSAKAINLLPNKTYECRVAVYKSSSFWGYSQIRTFKTDSVAFWTTGVTPTTLTLNWTDFSPWVTSYDLNYRPEGSALPWKTAPVYSPSHYIHSLTPNTTYDCKVYIYSGGFWGLSQTGKFSTPTTPPPGNGVSGDANSHDVNVYPNPFVDQVSMDLFTEEETNVTWNIYDITGKVVLSGSQSITTGYSTLNIDAANLSKGVYMLNAIINDQMQSFRIMKQ
jgi:hypothetical protein